MTLNECGITIASSDWFLLAGFPCADSVSFILNCVDFHADTPTLFHSTMSTLIPFIFVHNTFALKSANFLLALY